VEFSVNRHTYKILFDGLEVVCVFEINVKNKISLKVKKRYMFFQISNNNLFKNAKYNLL